MSVNCQDNDSMKKILYSIIPGSLFLVAVIVACNLPTITVQWPTTGTPTPSSTTIPSETFTPIPTFTSTITPVPGTETPLPTPTRRVTLTASVTPQPAPFCNEDAASQSQCRYPITGQSSAFCADKSPYNLIFLNDGATFQLLHEHVRCSEAGIINGQRMITCTGPMAYYFELQVCDSACSALRLETDDPRCPRGYRYNSLQGCCTNETQEVDGGCTVLKLRTNSCVINCGELTTKTTCGDYGYACRWNDTSNLCQLRK